jgi:AbrB family looped-hinge helix DNA binding protein
MRLRIGSAGRIVLPKPVRDRFGFRAGTDLDLKETADGVVLKPVSRRPSLVRAGRFLVHTGKLARGSDVRHAHAEDCEERLRKLAGL